MSLDDAIGQMIATDLDGTYMMTRWVVVAEIIEKTTGELLLHTFRDNTTPYWTARGMLDEAHLDEEWADLEADDDD